MRNVLKLEVAQNPICLKLSDPNFFDHIAESYRGFLSEREPKFVIETHISDEIPHTISTGSLVIPDGRGIRILNTSFWGNVDLTNGKGKIYTIPQRLFLSLKTFLRYVFIFLHLVDGDGLVLHALGVLKDGEVYVFFGPSGSGKTTAANLSTGHTILSDDLVFLRPEGGSYWVHPTPPWGDIQRGERENRPYPLRAVFKLMKAEKISMRRCNPVQAISDVITFPPMPAELFPPDRLLARFSHLAKRVPFYELRFVKDRSFWSCIEGRLRKIGIKNAKRKNHGEKDTH